MYSKCIDLATQAGDLELLRVIVYRGSAWYHLAYYSDKTAQNAAIQIAMRQFIFNSPHAKTISSAIATCDRFDSIISSQHLEEIASGDSKYELEFGDCGGGKKSMSAAMWCDLVRQNFMPINRACSQPTPVETGPNGEGAR